jgi:hypothetical protein
MAVRCVLVGTDGMGGDKMKALIEDACRSSSHFGDMAFLHQQGRFPLSLEVVLEVVATPPDRHLGHLDPSDPSST